MAIFTAIAAAFSAISSFTIGGIAVGSMLLQTAVGIGLNLLAQAVAGKPKKPTFAINGTLQTGGDVSRSFIVGLYATAGSLAWANTWGNADDTPNAFLTQVIALSDLPVGGLVEVWVNGEKVTLDLDNPHDDGRGYPIEEYHKDGSNNLWIKFYDGTQTAADSFLVVKASNGERVYEPTRVGYGVAYAIATARVTKNMFSGFPSFKFVLDGVKFYDITKDDTAGGDGNQRWSEPSTWGGDGDHFPAVQTYNLLRGVTWNGEWFYGLQGLGAARLPAVNWLAQVAKCRATIAGADGLEATYRSGDEIQIDAPLSAAMEAINSTCQGRISEVGGVYSMFLGAPDEPSFTFTDDDILSTEEQSFTPFLGLSDTINGIAATYPSPKDGWVMKPAPSLYRTDLEALHGNRRLMADVDLAFVPYPEQAQRLQSAALAEGQRARRHTHVLPPEFWAYAVPGAICGWTSARNGYITKSFRVDGGVDFANLDVMVDITEVDPADFDWNSETDYQPPVDGPVGPIRPSPAPIIDWFAEPATITNGNDVRPGLRLTWDGTKTGIFGVEFQVRLASTLAVVHQGRTDDPEAGAILISQNLFSNTLYGVRGRYILDGEQEALWSDWLAVTTPDVRDTDILAKFGSLSQGIKAQLAGLHQAAENFGSRMEQLATSVVEMAGQASQSQSVAVRLREAQAAVLQEISATVEEVEGQLTAAASAITALNATVGDSGAGALWRMAVTAGSGDVISRVELQVRATVGGAWVSAATIWEAGVTSGTPFGRILLSAMQTLIADGEGNVLALFDETGAYLDNARIRNLTAENITADKLDATEILQDGTLLTDLLAFNAVTEFEQAYWFDTGTAGGGSGVGESAWTHHGTTIVTNDAGTPMIEFISLRAFAVKNGGAGAAEALIIIKKNGNATDVGSGTLMGTARRRTDVEGNGTTLTSLTSFLPIGTTTVRYDIWTWNDAFAAPGEGPNTYEVESTSGVLWWKR